MDEILLMLPGPTTVHPRVLNAMSQAVVNHRGAKYGEILTETSELMSDVFQTSNQSYLLTGSGTAAMEAAISNVVNSGEKILNVVGGKFGERFMKIANAHGITTEELAVEWGTAVTPEAIKVIRESDAVILSMGSIFTSILPNLINKEIIDAIDNSNTKVIYVSNMVTQPGETDNFTVSDHVNLLNSYLGKKKIDVVIANNKKIDKNILKKYQTSEQKEQVVLDRENLTNVNLIEDDYFIIENNMVRHDALKVAFNIFIEVFKY